jgi:hypothetical protein
LNPERPRNLVSGRAAGSVEQESEAIRQSSRGREHILLRRLFVCFTYEIDCEVIIRAHYRIVRAIIAGLREGRTREHDYNRQQHIDAPAHAASSGWHHPVYHPCLKRSVTSVTAKSKSRTLGAAFAFFESLR